MIVNIKIEKNVININEVVKIHEHNTQICVYKFLVEHSFDKKLQEFAELIKIKISKNS